MCTIKSFTLSHRTELSISSLSRDNFQLVPPMLSFNLCSVREKSRKLCTTSPLHHDKETVTPTKQSKLHLIFRLSKGNNVMCNPHNIKHVFIHRCMLAFCIYVSHIMSMYKCWVRVPMVNVSVAQD